MLADAAAAPDVLSRDVGLALSAARAAVDQDDIRLFLHSLQHDLTAVRRHVEIAHIEILRQRRQSALRPRVEVDEPEILVLDLAAHDHDLVPSVDKADTPASARERETWNRTRASRRIDRLHGERGADICA